MDKRKATATTGGKVVGRKIAKTRQGHSKVFKNLTDLPIEVHLDGKENFPLSTLNRPHSSLAPEAHAKHALRIDSALSHYPQANRKRLSLDSTNKKHERESLLSKNSMSKKASRHQILIDETTRFKLAEDRRKYNSSCGSALEDRPTRKKLKLKRPSINNLHLNRREEKSQPRKDSSVLIQRDKTDKSHSRSRNKKGCKQSTTQLDKSKASTTILLPHKDKKFLKKKQSVSTAAMLPTKEKEKKKKARKAQRVEVAEESSQQEYPINKYYELQVRKQPKRASLKGREKGGRGSASKQREKHRKAYSLIEEIDYASCINIPSHSSGLINSLSHSSHHSTIKIIDNWEFRYFADEHPSSLNLEEMRYFQQRTHQHPREERAMLSKRFGHSEHYRRRKEIESEIMEEYPNFSQLQLKFLASVMFIQRKWRQHRHYRQLFRSFNNYELPSAIQKPNGKQLNISNGPKSAEKASKHTTQIDSAQMATTPFRIQREERKEEVKEEFDALRGTWLNNEAYLQSTGHAVQRQKGGFLMQQQRGSSSKQLSLKGHRYEFLQSEIFPNITYLMLKKEQLRQELHRNLQHIAQLQHNDSLLYEEYQKLKGRYEREYQKKLQELNKSKQEIKKGYLRFIDNYKDVRHQALRNVSSESGLMASMYARLFHFDQQHIATPSSSSESLKLLSKKVLIRKEFYLTQKIEPFIYNASQLQEDSHLSARLQKAMQQQQMELSARCFRSRRREEEGRRAKEMFIDIEGLNSQRLDLKRIKEGFMASPHFEDATLTLSFNKSEQLLPICIKSPRREEVTLYEHPRNHQRKERLVLQQVIASLTHQLYTELVSIDEKRESTVFSAESSRLNPAELRQLQLIEQSHSQQAAQEAKLREIYKIEGLQEKETAQRKHRNSKEHNISPASSEKYAFDCEDVILYAQAFIAFLRANSLLDEIISKLNKNQGFMPLEYLKFLRDFEIPEDEYDPLISNQAFVDWQDYFSAKFHSEGVGENQQAFVARQSVTIFHRCIFEAIIFLLQEFRPCGEKGLPFPWQKVIFFPRAITPVAFQAILSKCTMKLEQTVRLGCGIIDQKYIVYNEQDLQRIHEENEDKIINMLEKELALSPHNWYEVEEHCLEIKLELQCEILEYLMLEALDQILEAY